MTEKIRIQDDLYDAVNAEWLEKVEIPGDKPAAGGFYQLVEDNEKKLLDEFVPMRDGEKEVPQELSEFIKLYKQTSDFEARDAAGFEPVQAYIEKVEQTTDFTSWCKGLAEWVKGGYVLPFSLDIEPDYKNTDKRTLWFSSCGTILPDKSYYSEEKAEERERLLSVYRQMNEKLLKLYGKTDEEAKKIIDLTLAFDALVAPITNTSEENNQVEKVYNPLPLKEVVDKYSTIPLKEMLDQLVGFDLPEDEVVAVAELRFLDAFASLINAENFEKISAWMLVQQLSKYGSVLSEEIRQISGEYSRAISGIQEARPQDKHSFDLASGVFDQVVGLYYGHKFFGEQAKADVRHMVEEVIGVYKERLAKNDWLSKETIEKAIIKLDNLGVFVGYPDKLEDIYTKFIVDEAKSLAENVLHFSDLRREKKWAEYRLPVDREKWFMPAHQVNAYFNPTANHIVFPAAILQAPFYSIEQTPAQNYGGIGAVIAHEISHAFDNNGAQFDERGNMNNWWKEEDFEAFKEKQQLMIDEFEGVDTPAGKANGTLTVSENIADVGGVRAALTAAMREENVQLEEFWINWATIWRMKARLEFQTYLLSVDPHAPTKLRANLQAQNFAEFHETFHTKPGDGMWREEKDRVLIW